MKRLVQCGWWDEDDPDSLVYFKILDEKKVIWESSWYDIMDLNSSEIGLLRGEIVAALTEHGLDHHLVDSEDYTDWGESQ